MKTEFQCCYGVQTNVNYALQGDNFDMLGGSSDPVVNGFGEVGTL